MMFLRDCRKLILFICLFALLCFACREEDTVQELKAKSADVLLHVRVAGSPKSGATLIAIGGGPGLSSNYLINLEQFAGPDLRIVTYDQRGVGRSSGPSSYAINYDLLDYTKDLEAVRKTVGAEKVHLLGHYWGALVALRYASVYPERVGSIVLYGGAPPTWDWVVHANSRIVEKLETLIEEGIINIKDLLQGSPEWWREVIKVYFSDPNFWFSPEDDERPPDFNYNVNQLTWKAMGEYNLTTEFAKVNHRVLILFGEDDPAGMPLAVATRDVLSNADVEFVVIENCGQFWQECPEQFYAHVGNFLGLTAAP
jgi:pimeloyl-ACP methyl ester carboxylesterase